MANQVGSSNAVVPYDAFGVAILKIEEPYASWRILANFALVSKEANELVKTLKKVIPLSATMRTVGDFHVITGIIDTHALQNVSVKMLDGACNTYLLGLAIKSNAITTICCQDEEKLSFLCLANRGPSTAEEWLKLVRGDWRILLSPTFRAQPQNIRSEVQAVVDTNPEFEAIRSLHQQAVYEGVALQVETSMSRTRETLALVDFTLRYLAAYGRERGWPQN